MSKTRTIGKWKMTAKPKWLDNINPYDPSFLLTADIVTSRGAKRRTVVGEIDSDEVATVTFEIGE